MQENEALKQLLNIKDPWTVEGMEVTGCGNRVDIYVRSHLFRKSRLRLGRDSGRHTCSKCGLQMTAKTTDETKVWRHVNLGDTHCYVHAPAPPSPPCAGRNCPFMAPWGDLDSPFTAAMRHQLYSTLRLCGDLNRACRLLALSPEDVRRDESLYHRTTYRQVLQPEEYIPATGTVHTPEQDTSTSDPVSPVEPLWSRPTEEPASNGAHEESNSVPAVSHPNWQRLLNDELSIDVKALGLQMLLTHLRSEISQDMSNEERFARINEMRDYCIKYRRFVEYELNQLFESQ